MIPSDFDTITKLIELAKQHDLAEIEWRVDQEQIKIKRAVPLAAATVPSPPPIATTAAAPASVDDSGRVLEAPMVGIAYLAPEPGAAPFVKEGDRVEAGQTVLIIEAMKVMNQIPAPFSGVVRAIHIQDNKPVEYGQLLLSFD